MLNGAKRRKYDDYRFVFGQIGFLNPWSEIIWSRRSYGCSLTILKRITGSRKLIAITSKITSQ